MGLTSLLTHAQSPSSAKSLAGLCPSHAQKGCCVSTGGLEALHLHRFPLLLHREAQGGRSRPPPSLCIGLLFSPSPQVTTLTPELLGSPNHLMFQTPEPWLPALSSLVCLLGQSLPSLQDSAQTLPPLRTFLMGYITPPILQPLDPLWAGGRSVPTTMVTMMMTVVDTANPPTVSWTVF